MKRIAALIRKFFTSHHVTLAAAASVVAMFAEDAYRVFQSTGHVSRTDLQSIALTIGFSLLRGLVDGKQFAQIMTALKNQTTPATGATGDASTPPQ